MRLVQSGRLTVLNLDRLVSARMVPAADLEEMDRPALGDRLVLRFGEDYETVRGAEAAALWDGLLRCCGGEISVSEWAPAAVRRADLAELAAIAGQLRQSAAVPYSIDPLSAGHMAGRLESVRASLAGAEEGDPRDRDEDTLRAEDDRWPAPLSYLILDPLGRRSGLIGDVLAEARDLGALRDAADRISRTRPDVVDLAYPIVVGGGPDPDGAWGELRVVGPGRWHVRSGDGTVTILPGAYIL